MIEMQIFTYTVQIKFNRTLNEIDIPSPTDVNRIGPLIFPRDVLNSAPTLGLAIPFFREKTASSPFRVRNNCLPGRCVSQLR